MGNIVRWLNAVESSGFNSHDDDYADPGQPDNPLECIDSGIADPPRLACEAGFLKTGCRADPTAKSATQHKGCDE